MLRMNRADTIDPPPLPTTTKSNTSSKQVSLISNPLDLYLGGGSLEYGILQLSTQLFPKSGRSAFRSYNYNAVIVLDDLDQLTKRLRKARKPFPSVRSVDQYL